MLQTLPTTASTPPGPYFRDRRWIRDASGVGIVQLPAVPADASPRARAVEESRNAAAAAMLCAAPRMADALRDVLAWMGEPPAGDSPHDAACRALIRKVETALLAASSPPPEAV